MLKIDVRPYVICIVASMFVASSASAVPTNGDFSTPDLFGWTYSGYVSDDGGYAFFMENDSGDKMSSLWQSFTLPDGALNLSFELKMDIIGLPGSDAFTASLLDPVSLDPLISYDPGVTWYYYLESPFEEPNTVATVEDIPDDWQRVTLDVSSFAGQDVLLAFDLFSLDDTLITTVSLDNVEVEAGVFPIPTPSAAMLGLIGTATVGLIRKLNKISRA